MNGMRERGTGEREMGKREKEKRKDSWGWRQRKTEKIQEKWDIPLG